MESSAREPGSRAKIAVSSKDPDVDPVGACVGMKGSRVQAVVQELRGEKIDIVPYDEDPARFVCNAIAPAEVSRVLIDAENHTMELIVPDEKLSLAIGKKGQNVRLASQLTGWRIDIHSESKVRELEEKAKQSLAEIEGVSIELADTMFKLGWRSAEELSNASPQELMAIPGLGGMEGAQRIIAAAKNKLELQSRNSPEEKILSFEEEQERNEEERMLCVAGMDPELAQRLKRIGYSTVEAISQESDLNKLAQGVGISMGRAQLLHWAVQVYLGKADGKVPPTIEDNDFHVGASETQENN